MAIKRILVPVDFSMDSLNALNHARDFAKRFDAELLILHVIEPTYFADASDLHVASPGLATLLEEQRRIANAQTERIGADLQRAGQRFRTLVQRGAPAQVIVDTAKSSGTDMIVMATHGRTGPAHMLMGSVADKVVRSAHCLVLTVRRAVGREPKPAKATGDPR
jgi:nucleotide-binding universal stress UspA family protein